MAIAVLIMAFLGAAMWLGFQKMWKSTEVGATIPLYRFEVPTSRPPPSLSPTFSQLLPTHGGICSRSLAFVTAFSGAPQLRFGDDPFTVSTAALVAQWIERYFAKVEGAGPNPVGGAIYVKSPPSLPAVGSSSNARHGHEPGGERYFAKPQYAAMGGGAATSSLRREGPRGGPGASPTGRRKPGTLAVAEPASGHDRTPSIAKPAVGRPYPGGPSGRRTRLPPWP
jgi:hypothetical protein